MFCRQCGKELAPDSNFCDGCGTGVDSYPDTSVGSEEETPLANTEAAAPVYEMSNDMPQFTGERTMGIIPVLKKPKSFGRWDTYAMVITDRRSIFPQITSQMLKDAAMEAQRKGKEEGKGFFSRWADQLKSLANFAQRYWNIPPEEILNETVGNFAIENSAIREIKVKRKEDYRGDDVASQTYTEIKIDSAIGEFKYNIDGRAGDEVNILKSLFGERVKVSKWGSGGFSISI
ncbi:MAG: zinc ribbon domain-containing protein [Dehalococcoidales bacterium]|nr:zinc ribbon domain-containing protein [Dehalococcoidales bacterium]